MRLHSIRHVPYEGLGMVGQWARSAGHEIVETRPYDGDAFPDPAAIDYLVVLGGPMGACDERVHPWLADELRFLERAVATGTPVLGICLGAQLLARVLGAAVRRHVHPEIGWFRVQPTDLGRDTALAPFFEPGVRVLQWHFDAFDLPAGALRLATSEACENQAFSWGENLLALQFHPEMTPEEVATILARDGSPPPGPWTQAPEEMLDPGRFRQLQAATDRFLARYLQPGSS